MRLIGSDLRSWLLNTTANVGPSLAPLGLSNLVMLENIPVGTVIGTLSGMTPGSSVTLTGTSGGAFALSGNNIVTAAAIDRETLATHPIAVTETLPGYVNSPRVTNFTLIVTDVPAPTAAGGIADRTVTQGVAITPINGAADFTVPAGSGAATYSLAPSSAALPAGLSLNAATGQITGTPTTPAAAATIVIRCTTIEGFADSAFQITVQAASAAPSDLAMVQRFLQNTGTWAMPAMQLVPTSNAHSYVKTVGPVSVTVDASGYLNINTATLLGNSRVVIEATDSVTSRVTTLEFSISVLTKPPAHYTAATQAEFNAVMALGGATLNGKVIEITAPISANLAIPDMGGNSIAIRSAAYGAHVGQITISGTHGVLDFSHLHIWHRVWPRVIDGIITRNLGSNIDVLRFNDAYIHHGYGPTNAPWDTGATLPEYAVQRLDLTADVTSQRYALSINDPTNPSGGFCYAYGSANPVYMKYGDSTVVATASDTQINAYTGSPPTPQSPGWGAGAVPTHVAVISPSGPQSIRLKVNQPIATYLASLFSWVGQNRVGTIEFQRTWLDSLADCIKPGNMPGCSQHIIDRCIATAIYHDIISTSIDGALDLHSVTRNTFQISFAYRTGLAWTDVCDPGDPHSDGDQIFSTSNGTINVCLGAGNMFLPFKVRPGVVPQADFYWQNGGTQPAYAKSLIIGNLLGAGGGNNDAVAETALVYGNTAFSPLVPAAETSVGARGAGTAPTAGVLARNIAGKYTVGAVTMKAETIETAPGNLDTLFANWPDRLLATDRTAARAIYAGKAGSAAEGLGFDAGYSAIDWQTEDPLAVVKWDQVPGYVQFLPQIGVAASTVVTSATARLITGPIPRLVTPQAGVEWRWADTLAGISGAAWLTAAATVTPLAGNYHVFMEVRYTTPATGLADTSLGVTIAGYTNTFRTVTDPVAFFTTANASATYFRDPASPYAPAGCDLWEFKAWVRLAASEAGYLLSIPSINIELELMSNAGLRCNVKDGAGTSMFSASTFSGLTMPAAQWTYIYFAVDYVAQEARLTLDDTTVIKTFPAAPVGRPNGQPTLLARSNASGPIAGDIAYLELLYNGVSDVVIQGNAATANAHAWKLGANAT